MEQKKTDGVLNLLVSMFAGSVRTLFTVVGLLTSGAIYLETIRKTAESAEARSVRNEVAISQLPAKLGEQQVQNNQALWGQMSQQFDAIHKRLGRIEANTKGE